jgi:cysteine rich repeat protein
MKRLFVLFLVCAMVFVVASGAFAQDNNPCATDIARFCGNIEPGKGRIANCLRQNETQLSPGCKVTGLPQAGDALKEAQEACEDDIVMFCGGVQPEGGRLLKCLKLNEPQLSSECKEKLLRVYEQLP